MIKQFVIAVFILISVTVLSLGIRYVRFSAHRANTIEKSVAANTRESTLARPSDYEEQIQSKQSFGVKTESGYYPEAPHAVNAEPEPQQANVSNPDESESWDYLSEAKPFEGGYAKSEGLKGLEKISLGDYENLYITGDGELWYVIEQPDGKTGKVQVQIDKTTGEFTTIGGGYYAISEGSQGLQRISAGKNEDIYLTGNDELWYVSELPDGSTAKMQLRTENLDGEMTIVGSGEMNVYPADGDKSNED
jgi:hypothetical protein